MTTYPFKPFITGMILSSLLLVFFYFGIVISYNYLPVSILVLIGLPMVCFLTFWLNNKYGKYLDVNDVFRKTISFNDFKMRNSKKADFFMRHVRPLNTYVGAIGVIAGFVALLLVIPSIIIYWVCYPDSPGKLIAVSVFVLSAGMCLVFFAGNKEEFPLSADKIAFVSGVLLGAAGVIAILH